MSARSIRTLAMCLLSAHAAAGQYAEKSFIPRNEPAVRFEAPAIRMAQIPEPRPESSLYRWSLVALTAANVADVATTWGRPELNPLLSGAPRFGVSSLVVKSAIFGTTLLAQRYMLHTHAGLRRPLIWVNFVGAGGVGALAFHNQTRGAPRR